MPTTSVYHPRSFFFLAYLITSVIWCIAAYISYQPALGYLLFSLIFGGMSGPTIAAIIMFTKSKNRALWSDFLQRLRFDSIKPHFIPTILLLMPALVISGIIVSALCGFSLDQLGLTQSAPDQALEGKNLAAIFLVVFLSCSLEEIGWRGYGIDSLNSRFNLWWTSLIFAALWGLWHVPAFFILHGYFQQEVWNLGWIHIMTYFVSLWPVTILINWAYVKNNRSILIAIFMHSALNLSMGLLRIQPFTKIIIMLLMLSKAGIVVLRNRELFFTSSKPAGSKG